MLGVAGREVSTRKILSPIFCGFISSLLFSNSFLTSLAHADPRQ